MTTYALKLKDPRWATFREAVFEHYGEICVNCGTDHGIPIQVHHKRYHQGCEPWEYEMKDVVPVCKDCHEEIHECETLWRNMIRQMPLWMITEFKSMAEAVHGMNPDTRCQWASYCKNQARGMKGYKHRQEGADW